MSIRRVTIPEDYYDKEYLDWLREHNYPAFREAWDNIIDAYMCELG